MRGPSRLLALAATALLGGALVLAGAGGAAAQTIHLDEGHVDVLSVSYSGGALVVQVLDDTGSAPVVRSPQDVTFGIKSQAKLDLSSVSWTDCLDGEMWVLPHVPTTGLLYPGWNASGVGSGIFTDDKVQFAITGIDNSDANGGHVTLFRPSEQRVLLDSAGCDDANSEDVLVGSHDHPAWAFSEAGTYRVTFEVTGSLVAGGGVSSGSVEYIFIVD